MEQNDKRVILHCDCNSFFASVESVLNPEYKKVPMAVCGNPENRHGIVLAKNELAKKFNISTGEAIWQAKKKCPQLVIAQPHFDLYGKYSDEINKIYYTYTDMIEPFGIDESWLDVTGSERLFGNGKKIADELREKVCKQTGLTISVGVSFNKIFAKLGSDYKKPDATTVIPYESYKEIVYPLPVSDLLFVGNSSKKSLSILGIKTIGDLALTERRTLEKYLGKIGGMLYEYANGLECSPVAKSEFTRSLKSVGNGYTFKHDLSSKDDVRSAVYSIADKVSSRMREELLKCQTLSVTIRDYKMNTITRQITLEEPTFISRELAENAISVIYSNWDGKIPLRALTITGNKIIPANEVGEQLSVFEDKRQSERQRLEALEFAVDKIRSRYGFKSIYPASVKNNTLGL